MICSRCGQKLADWHFGDENYCQECFESYYSEECEKIREQALAIYKEWKGQERDKNGIHYLESIVRSYEIKPS